MYLRFLDHGSSQVTETKESETKNKGKLLCNGRCTRVLGREATAWWEIHTRIGKRGYSVMGNAHLY